MLTQYNTLSNGKSMSGFSPVVNGAQCCAVKNIYSTEAIISIFSAVMVFVFKSLS